mmetsp:Transcript_15427/g.33443  ORF Transcript_15427/g.33443 Transcript_15427/m.33443 type:complete len:205 (-) Transcript_15427:3578-4192(-)
MGAWHAHAWLGRYIETVGKPQHTTPVVASLCHKSHNLNLKHSAFGRQNAERPTATICLVSFCMYASSNNDNVQDSWAGDLANPPHMMPHQQVSQRPTDNHNNIGMFLDCCDVMRDLSYNNTGTLACMKCIKTTQDTEDKSSRCVLWGPTHDGRCNWCRSLSSTGQCSRAPARRVKTQCRALSLLPLRTHPAWFRYLHPITPTYE